MGNIWPTCVVISMSSRCHLDVIEFVWMVASASKQLLPTFVVDTGGGSTPDIHVPSSVGRVHQSRTGEHILIVGCARTVVGEATVRTARSLYSTYCHALYLDVSLIRVKGFQYVYNVYNVSFVRLICVLYWYQSNHETAQTDVVPPWEPARRSLFVPRCVPLYSNTSVIYSVLL